MIRILLIFSFCVSVIYYIDVIEMKLYSGVARSAQPYVERYIEMFDRVPTTSIKLGHIEDDIAGLCYIAENHIIIDKSFWYTATDIQREELVIHELAHCDLGLEYHDDEDDEVNEGKCHFYTDLNSECYRKNKADYINNLKHRSS